MPEDMDFPSTLHAAPKLKKAKEKQNKNYSAFYETAQKEFRD